MVARPCCEDTKQKKLPMKDATKGMQVIGLGDGLCTYYVVGIPSTCSSY